MTTMPIRCSDHRPVPAKPELMVKGPFRDDAELGAAPSKEYDAFSSWRNVPVAQVIDPRRGS